MSLKYFLIAIVIALSMCHHFERKCPKNTSSCLAENGPRCCKYKNAVCCPNMRTCCPKGYECSENGCQKPESNEIVEMSELNRWTFGDLKKLNWNGILRCLTELPSAGSDVVKLIKAIKSQNYLECAQIAFDLLGKGVKIVQKCIEYNKKNELNQLENKMKFGFDWDALIKCIMSAAPLVQDVILLADAIRAKDYAKAIAIVYKLIEEGSIVVKECMKVVILHQNKLGFNWEEFLKCLKQAAPLVKEIEALIEAIVAKDYAKALELAYKLIESGSVVVKQCMKVVVVRKNKFKFDWDAFLKCIMATAPMVKEILDLIAAIEAGDFVKALQLVYQLISSGSEIVKECMKVVLRNKKFIEEHYLDDNFLKFNWDAFLKCIMSTAPMVEEILKLIEAIQKGDYVTAIQLIYKLIASGSEIIKECMKVVDKNDEDGIENVFAIGFDWDAFLKCIMATAPMVKEILDLIAAIEAGDFVKAIKLIYELIASGSEAIKECMKVILENNGIEPNGWFKKVFNKVKKFVKKVIDIYQKVKPWVDKGIEIIRKIKERRNDLEELEELAENKISIRDILQILSCLKTTAPKIGPIADKIKELSKAAQSINILKALRLYGELERDAKEIITACKRNSNGIKDIVMSINWKAVYNCILTSKPTVAGLLKLYTLIKEKKYEEAYYYAYSLIQTGHTFIRECIEEFRSKNDSNKIKLNVNWKKVLKCLKEAKPIAKEVLELIQLIKEKKYKEALGKGYIIIQKGNQLVQKCFNKSSANDVEVNIDWQALLKCLINHIPEFKEDVFLIKQLIEAIKTQDFALAFELAYKLFKDGKEVYNLCFAPKNKIKLQELKIDWDLLLECIKEAGPIAKEIKGLVEAIKVKIFKQAAVLVKKILKTGNQLIKKCVKVATKK